MSRPSAPGAAPAKAVRLARVTESPAPLDLPPLNLDDFEALARRRLTPGVYAYYGGGAGRELSLRENEAAFTRLRLRPRVLVDVSQVETEVELFGRRWAMPVGIAPTAQHGMAHGDAEAATARAATASRVPYCASTSSTLSCEQIAAAAPGPFWFQLYAQDGRGPETNRLLERALRAGYEALVLTVDLPVLGVRERDRRLRFNLDSQPFGNFPSGRAARHPTSSLSPEEATRARSTFTWSDVDWLRSKLAIPLILKGIMTDEDAVLAVEHGADAVWVSNHGGRQLDGCAAPVDVLEEVVRAVAGRVPVFVDGGVRRGTDVVAALALGAAAVFVGRPVLYALAAGGETGVRQALALLGEELRNAMALLGTPRLADITRHHVR